MCTGVEGPNRVFTNTSHGSDSSKAQTKKAKDTEKSSKPSSASGANLKADDGKHRATSMKKKIRSLKDSGQCQPFAITRSTRFRVGLATQVASNATNHFL